MLERLDKVDWKRLNHTSKQPWLIPSNIRNLLSSDKKIRELARNFLFEYGQVAGTVSEATAYIVPIILELLGHDDTPDKKWLLFELGGLDFDLDDEPNPNTPRAVVKTAAYQAVELGIPLFLRFLKHSDSDIRGAAIGVFERLTNSRDQFLPHLISALGQENNEAVRESLQYVIDLED